MRCEIINCEKKCSDIKMLEISSQQEVMCFEKKR